MKRLILILAILSTITAHAANTKIEEATLIYEPSAVDRLVIIVDPNGTPLGRAITIWDLFNFLDTSAELLAIMDNETGSSAGSPLLVFNQAPTIDSPTFTTAITATDLIDSAHYAADSIDNEHINWEDLTYLDDNGAVDIAAYDAVGTFESGDTFLVLEAGVGIREADYDDLPSVSTAWDDIGDPDNNGQKTITFDNAETTRFVGDNDAASSFFTIQNTDVDHTVGQLYLLDLYYSGDDGDADADYIRFRDSGGDVLTIQQDGDMVSQGNIEAVGLLKGGSIVTGGLMGLDGDPDLLSLAANTLTINGTLAATTLTEGGNAVYNDDEMDTYPEINAIVTDVTLTHNGLIDTFAKIDAIVADKALVNKADGATWAGTHDFKSATVKLPARVIFCFNIHDIDDGMDDIKMPFPSAMTITQVTAYVTGGTNVVGRLYEVDGDGDDSDAVGVEVADWTFTTGETEDTSFNNATFDAGDYIQWDTTSVSGAVTGFMICVWGYET